MRRSPRQNNQSGFLTVDFMLAMLVTTGCLLLLLRVSLSLMTVQLAQYVMYATARAQAAGDVSREAQIRAGELKYKNLLSNADLATGFLIPGETIQKSGVAGDFSSVYIQPPNYDGTTETGMPSWGARAELTFPKLSFIPFLGNVAGETEEFKAHVNALLFREPSSAECREFFTTNNIFEIVVSKDRTNRLRKATSFTNYVPMEDSGC